MNNITKQTSRSSDTPETDEFSKKQYIRMAASSNNAVDLLNDALEETENHARKLERERDEARQVAENLVEYAHECLVQLESWGKGYDRYEREMETIREAIAGCEKWREAAK